jgi:ATP-dependent Clp protease ATP-binding subunit ClpB
VGYDEGGQLTEAVRRKPYSVVLLDEIEKAHPDTFNILLQVLEDGRLTDNKGRMANFKNTIIIMTSNIGSEIIQDNFAKAGKDNLEDIITETRGEIFELLKRSVRPEFLNRIDELVMFRPLTLDNMDGIIRLQFRHLEELLKKQDITFEVSERCLDYLKNSGFNLQFGARPLKRLMQKKVLDGLSLAMLSDRIGPGMHILIDAEGNQVTFRPKEHQSDPIRLQDPH